MKKISWIKLTLLILVLAILASLSACQAVKGAEQTIHSFSTVPDRIGNAVTNIFSSIGDVGKSLSNMVGNIIGNMTGR